MSVPGDGTGGAALDARVGVITRRAREASRRLGCAPTAERDAALEAIAAALERHAAAILAANARDLDAARVDVERGAMTAAAFDRLVIDEGKLGAMVAGVRAVAALPDPVGRVTLARRLDAGLELRRVTCPLGVIAVIFESRPDAVTQIAALALKSGNASILKPGSEATASAGAILAAVNDGLARAGAGFADAVQAIAGRDETDALLRLDTLVDLVVPRGSSDLVRSITARTKIPVLGHADGICHVYVHADADTAMARAIVRDAKTQYPAACNAIETLLVDAAAAARVLPVIAADLESAGVELRGCARARAVVPRLQPATDADWDTEYGALVLSIRVVDGLPGAIDHIARHGSRHTEAIVCEDPAAAARFMTEVDAAGVFHNASTRFADGFRYGFGAEVGIATSKLHARGPVGLEGLVTYKYLLAGEGHVVATYSGPAARRFLHETLAP